MNRAIIEKSRQCGKTVTMWAAINKVNPDTLLYYENGEPRIMKNVTPEE